MSLEAAGHLPEMFPDSGGEAGEALGLRVPPGLLHLPGQTQLGRLTGNLINVGLDL